MSVISNMMFCSAVAPKPSTASGSPDVFGDLRLCLCVEGLIHVGDELKEVNGIPVDDKKPEEIIHILVKCIFLVMSAWGVSGSFPHFSFNSITKIYPIYQLLLNDPVFLVCPKCSPSHKEPSPLKLSLGLKRRYHPRSQRYFLFLIVCSITFKPLR